LFAVVAVFLITFFIRHPRVLPKYFLAIWQIERFSAALSNCPCFALLTYVGKAKGGTWEQATGGLLKAEGQNGRKRGALHPACGDGRHEADKQLSFIVYG